MFGLINMNARLYNPALGRFLGADPFVQAPDFSQAYNRYSYANNNPLMYTDPSGEIAWFYFVGAALVGGISNLVANWDNVDGFWDGLSTFGVGAGAACGMLATGGAGAGTVAVLGAAAGTGAVVGANNSIVAQTGTNFSGFNQVDWGQVGVSGAIGGVAGFVGGATGTWAANTNWLVNGVSHPLAKSAIVSPLAAGAGHIAGGTTANLFAGQSLDNAFANSFKGIEKSMAIGGAIGVVTTAGIMYASGKNPLTRNPLTTKTGTTVLEGTVKSNYRRFVSKMPANAKSSTSFQLLDDGNYLFQATSPGKVPGSSALYQKWVNPQGETFRMIKTTFAPDGSIIHIKPKF
jgi:RHS repeat-associated protein